MKGRDDKKEGVTRNHGFPYREGRERQLAWARPWKLRRPEVTGLGVSALEVRRNYGGIGKS